MRIMKWMYNIMGYDWSIGYNGGHTVAFGWRLGKWEALSSALKID
jgi:hypothetical protein